MGREDQSDQQRMSACSYLELFYRFPQGNKSSTIFFFFSRLALHPSLVQGKRKVVFAGRLAMLDRARHKTFEVTF